MGIFSSSRLRRGFALPTVLIASVVLLIVLSVSVTATTAARNALKDQYYAQLAQVAGEAGVAMAQACLQANNNTVTWSDANPLTPATDCTGTVNIVSGTCPSDDECWVTVEDNIRSGFSVPEPDLDVDGRPVSIPQTGFVEIWRESTGAAWRVYRQPSAQAAVVPALCSGAARSDLGWSNASITSPSGSFITTTARPISISTTSIVSGPIQFRKDFNIVEAGSYTIQAKGDDRLKLYLDGAMLMQTTTDNQTGTVTVTIPAGCHVLHATVNNYDITSGPSNLILSLKKQGGANELVVSDASWRVSAGTTQGYAVNNYSASPNWADVRNISAYNAGAPWAEPANWTATANDASARWISTNHSFTGTNYPFNQYAYFRTKKVAAWNFSTTTEIQFYASCDDSCTLLVDGSPVLNASVGVTATSKVTFQPGQHTLAVELYNGGASANPGGFIVSAKRTSDNVVIDRTDANWVAANAWYSSVQTLQSFDDTFHPSPDTYSCNCATQGTSNLINNPSIETVTTGYSVANATQSRSTSADNNGSWGLRVTVSALGTMPRTMYTSTNIEPGQLYTISAYAMGSVDTRLSYFYKDALGTAIPINGTSQFYSTPVNPGGVFARLSMVTQPAPPQAKSIEIWVGMADNTPVATFTDIDDLMLSPGPTLPNYGDGSLTGWGWLGTAHTSTSSGPAF